MNPVHQYIYHHVIKICISSSSQHETAWKVVTHMLWSIQHMHCFILAKCDSQRQCILGGSSLQYYLIVENFNFGVNTARNEQLIIVRMWIFWHLQDHSSSDLLVCFSFLFFWSHAGIWIFWIWIFWIFFGIVWQWSGGVCYLTVSWFPWIILAAIDTASLSGGGHNFTESVLCLQSALR